MKYPTGVNQLCYSPHDVLVDNILLTVRLTPYRMYNTADSSTQKMTRRWGKCYFKYLI